MTSFDPCSFLYTAAQTRNGQTFEHMVAGRKIVVVQEMRGANQVLRANADNYHKELWPFRQVMGASRLTEDGANWREREAVTQPFLARFDTQRLGIVSCRHANSLAQQLVQHAQRGRLNQFAIDVTTIRVLADTLLDGRLSDEAEEFAADLHAMLSFASSYAFSTQGSSPQVSRETTRDLAQTRQRMLKRLTAVRCDLPAGNNVLQALDGADTDGLADIVFQHELMMLFSAGADTSAAALGWCCLALAENQAVQNKVRAEVNALEEPQLSDAETISRLPWLNGLIDETMRLYPPIPMLGRLAREADVIGEVPVAADTPVLVSLIGIHRNADLWPDPDTFSANRHGLNNQRSARAIPFSTGPRICGGSRFAMLETRVILANLVRQLRFTHSGQEPGDFQWRISMRRKLAQPVNVAPVGAH